MVIASLVHRLHCPVFLFDVKKKHRQVSTLYKMPLGNGAWEQDLFLLLKFSCVCSLTSLNISHCYMLNQEWWVVLCMPITV